MKCRLPAKNRLTKKQAKACEEYSAEQVRKEEKHCVRRLFKLFCWTLNRDFGFGKNRLMKLLFSVSELSAKHEIDEVFWEHCDRYLNEIGLDFEPEEYEDILQDWKNRK